MGKDKSSQRTKGNLQPSSSVRSAEVLGGIKGFVGFGNQPGFNVVPATTQSLVEDDSQLSPVLRITLRKLSKKDSTTKLKGLQEFTNLCSSEDDDCIKACLAYWPRIYVKLSIDTDVQVREYIQIAHAALVAKTGKNFAPCLRSVMPMWLLAMSDSHGPSSRAATNSFQNMFSLEKRPGVMVFCSREIVEFASDNLFSALPKMLSEKSSDVKDAETTIVRCLSGSLQVLTKFLDFTVGLKEKKDEIVGLVSPIIQNERFWKLAFHESSKKLICDSQSYSTVKKRWHETVRSMLIFEPELLRPHISELRNVLIRSLDCQDNGLLPHVWELYLNLNKLIPEISSEPESVELYFNRIFAVLKEGGRGSGQYLAVLLCPLLSVLPKGALSHPRKFYSEFFSSIITGLPLNRSAKKSVKFESDNSAFISALFECLLFVAEEMPFEVWEDVFQSQVFSLVNEAILDMNFVSYETLFKKFSYFSFSFFCLNKSSFDPKEKLKYFFDSFSTQLTSLIAQKDPEKLGRLNSFFCTMMEHSPSDLDSKTLNDTISANMSTNQEQSSQYRNFLSSQFSPFTRQCFACVTEDKNEVVLSMFADLLRYFSTDQLYRLLASENLTSDDENSEWIFLRHLIFPLIDELESESWNCLVIDVILIVYDRLMEANKSEVLTFLQSRLSPSGLKYLMEKLLTKEDEKTRSWFTSIELTDILVQLLEELIDFYSSMSNCPEEESHRCVQIKGLILYVFSHGSKHCEVFSSDCANRLLRIITNNLPNPDEKMNVLNFNEYIEFSISAFNSFIHHSSVAFVSLDESISFVKSIFEILCFKSTYKINEREFHEVETCFFSTLETWSSVASFCDDFISNLILPIFSRSKEFVTNSSCDFASILHSVELLRKVLCIVFKGRKEMNVDFKLFKTDFYVFLLGKILPSEEEWEQLEEQISPLFLAQSLLTGEIIGRNIDVFLENAEVSPLNLEYIRVSLLIVKIILFLKNPFNEDGFCDGEEYFTVNFEFYLPVLASLLQATSYAKFLIEWGDFVFTEGGLTFDQSLGLNHLVQSFKQVANLLSVERRNEITQIVSRRSLNSNTRWCATLREALSLWPNSHFSGDKGLTEMNENLPGWLETKQVCLLKKLLLQDNVYFSHSFTCIKWFARLTGFPAFSMKDALLYGMDVNILTKVIEEESLKLESFASSPYRAFASLSFISAALDCRILTDLTVHSEHPSFADSIERVFQVLNVWRDSSDDILVLESSIVKIKWKKVSLLTSIAKILRCVVKKFPKLLNQSHWDTLLCAITSWSQTTGDLSKFVARNSPLALFTSECCRLIVVVSEFFGEREADESSASDETALILKNEWFDFFTPAIFTMIMIHFTSCANSYENARSLSMYWTLKEISAAVSSVTRSTLLKVDMPPLFVDTDEDSLITLPHNLQFLLNHASHILLSRHWWCQTAAFSLLDKIMEEVMIAWDVTPASMEEEEEIPCRPLPHVIRTSIEEASASVDSTLANVEFGSSYKFSSKKNMFHHFAGYLLAWLLLLKAMRESKEEGNQQLYASYIRDSGLFTNLLNNLFKILPDSPFFEKHRKCGVSMIGTHFSVLPLADAQLEDIEWASCRLFFRCLTQLPAAVRAWWVNLDRVSQQIVDAYTTTHFSPILIADEIARINKSSCTFDNMVVKSRPGVREIVAVYTIDEASMELVLRLPPNYPLSTVALEDHKRVGVSISQWRNWLFGLNTMLSHRNTPLLSSLIFWKSNVDQKFKGIEECYICYYVLHGSNHQLPKLQCRTCKKKFHASCLFKWFNTSNNSTCPICRCLF